MHTSSRITFGSCLLLVLIFLCTIFFRLGSLPFIGADEPRYARIAEEMNAQGRWVTPILEGRPWLEKPPLYYWITIPFYRIFGVSETSARLGTALLTLMAAFFVFWMGTRLWTRRAGFFGAVIFLTSVGTVAFGRSASTDMPLTACFTIGLAILGVALFSDLAAWKIWCAYALLGLSILGKGPVGLLLWAGIGFSFWLLDERGDIVRRWRVLRGILIIAAVSLPWFWLAFRENGFAFIAIFIVNHNIARYITDIHHHTQPVYYFLPILPALFFPWTAWLLLAWPRPFRATMRHWREWDRRSLFLACWILFPLLFFSFSRSKLPGYILPCIPPLALILGARISEYFDAADTGEPVRRSRLPTIAGWAHMILSAALAAAFPVVFLTDYGGTWTTALPISAACVLPAFYALHQVRRGRPPGAFNATALQGVVLILALTQFAFPGIARHESARGISRQILALREGAESIATYNYFSHPLNYYTGYRISEDLPDPVILGRYAASHPRFLVVTDTPHLAEIAHLERLGCTVTLLGEQGNLRLFRVTSRSK